jgi:tripartite-type tricarboxylate transporter receptor subunit TctC
VRIVADVMGGQAQVLFNGMLATCPSVKDGTLRGLAISSEKARWAKVVKDSCEKFE